jgi:class 3 adenylate cyclase
MVFQVHTFLFADLVGFTRFTAVHGDDRAADLAISFYERVCSIAAGLGCDVVKAVGDGVMVRGMNGPAIVELAKRILALATQEGFPPARVGVDSGPAVERNGDWFGSTVNTAARVASLASAGELLMTERTRRSLTGVSSFALADRGRHTLKGLPDHVLFSVPREISAG